MSLERDEFVADEADVDSLLAAFLATIEQIFATIHADEADVLLDLAMNRILLPRINGETAPSRVVFETRHGRSAREIRTLEAKARKILQAQATNLFSSVRTTGETAEKEKTNV